MATLQEKLEAKKKKIEQEKVQLQKLQTRLNQEERKKDTRRKILTGAVVLSAMERDEKLKAYVERMRDKELKSEYDRALFDLEPLPKPAEPVQEQEHDQ